MTDLLRVTPDGLYCEAGDFFIDPWKAVPAAVVTHAHADHLKYGCGSYLIAAPGLTIFRARVGNAMTVECADYGQTTHRNGVAITLYPAGHLLGSAQVLVEYRGERWVVSGDYKVAADTTCRPFEAIPCHTFVTESTFGLPIYRWEPPQNIFAAIDAWWRRNAMAGKTSVLLAYSLGKAQRLLAGIDASIGPIYGHGAVEAIHTAYRTAGVALPATQYAYAQKGFRWAGSLIIAPPSAQGSPWLKKFAPLSLASASGWMRIRGTRRRRALDRGFVLSDHADWPGLLSAIVATGASRVLVTHGYTAVLSRYLRDKGIDAGILETRYQGEVDDTPAEQPGDPPAEAPL
jgi:putative mRNA 3-end processing factor